MAGKVTATRSLEDGRTGRVLGADGGSEELPAEVIEGPVAVATGNIGMTLTTDTQYEMLRLDLGGHRPCSVRDFDSGRAHKKLLDHLRAELKHQIGRGLEGLRDE